MQAEFSPIEYEEKGHKNRETNRRFGKTMMEGKRLGC